MEYLLPPEVQDIITTLKQAGYQVFLVGGVVRDLLLNRPHSDWDLTTNATPEQMLQLFPDSHNNNQFGTVGIPLENGVVQITTMRQESDYQDSRHPDSVTWTNKIEEDLARRDFTINAMALDGSTLVDPFNGQQDLQDKIIKAVGEPEKRFQEDALRLLRAIRFSSQLGFQIDNDTWQAILQNKDLLKNISQERIRDELLKIIVSQYADQGMIMLKSSGLLEIILPEVIAGFEIMQQGPRHARKYNIGEHLIASMCFTPTTDPIVKLAALLHDIGKPKTLRMKDGNTTFYHHEMVGAEMALEITKRLKLSAKEQERIYTLVRYHMFPVNENQTDSALRRFIKNIGIENIEPMMAIREGDRLGGGTASPTSWRFEQFKERIQQLLIKPFSINDLKINGHDVMETLNIPASRKIGEILNQLFEEVIEDPSKNDKEYLLKRLPEFK